MLEALVLNGLVLVALHWELRHGRALDLLWGGLGALAALTTLGAWSAGYVFAPGLFLGVTAGCFATARCRGNVARAVAMLLAGFVGQIAIMFMIIALMTRYAPRPQS